MRSYFRSILVIALVGFLPSTGFAQTTAADSNRVERRLLKLEREWLDAYENNDVKAMQRILANGFKITYPGGRILEKEDVIASLHPGKANEPSSRQYTTGSAVRLFGTDTAVITGTYVFEKEGRVTWRARYTDTYVKSGNEWQVAASGLSSMRPGEK